jgi:hypothetical protein
LGMNLQEQFKIIRPYRDPDVKPAIERLVKHPKFHAVLNYLFEGMDLADLTERFKSIETIHQFQLFFSHHTVKTILEKTSSGITEQGYENLDTKKSYLFVANHRDIVLDAAIMQYLLYNNGHRTSQITFGENLMTEQLLLDIGKLNKMFTFYRGGSRIEQYNNAIINSAYINHVIKTEDESIWIAQRNGRTKNGDDRTQTGLIKMLTVGSDQVCSSLASLNIVPVTISYEIEPCDIQKVRELYISRRKEYVKTPTEDFLSILAGITGKKGHIHYAFGKPLNDFILSMESEELHTNEIVERITGEIDRQVHKDFMLWPGNYIAYDLLRGTTLYKDRYSNDQKMEFEGTMNKKTGTLEGFDQGELRDIYLQMYANPVINKRNLQSA